MLQFNPSVLNAGNLVASVSTVFDGRYIYIGQIATGGAGTIYRLIRYDTTLDVTSSSSYTTIITTTINASFTAVGAMSFDGRYVYYYPENNGVLMARYDTTLSFTSVSSYLTFNPTTVNANTSQFYGTAFDGRYIYTISNASGYILRYDTKASFTSTGSYSVYNTTFTNMTTGLYDGRYVYYFSNQNSGNKSMFKYDTNLSFTSAGSYSQAILSSVDASYKSPNHGVCFDGRFIYIASYKNISNVATGKIIRYDTTLSPTDYTNSYDVFDAATINANIVGIGTPSFDGRYVHFFPSNPGGFNVPYYLMYDTTLPFKTSSSYQTVDVSSLLSNGSDYRTSIFDGKYVYGLGSNTQGILRVEAYSGPQLLFNNYINVGKNTNSFALGIGASSTGSNEVVIGNTTTTSVAPAANNNCSLGTPSFQWSNIYTQNVVTVSDRNEKQEIKECELGLDFINKLKPVSYKFNSQKDNDNRIHHGLIAQEVEEILPIENHIVQTSIIDGIKKYGLVYTEIISPLIKSIQELNTRLKYLENKVS